MTSLEPPVPGLCHLLPKRCLIIGDYPKYYKGTEEGIRSTILANHVQEIDSGGK